MLAACRISSSVAPASDRAAVNSTFITERSARCARRGNWFAITSLARTAKSVGAAARLSDSGALTADSAAVEVVAERLRSNDVDGRGPVGSVGSGAKPPGGAIDGPARVGALPMGGEMPDPVGPGAATICGVIDGRSGTGAPTGGGAIAGALRVGAVLVPAGFVDGAADAIEERSFAGDVSAGEAGDAAPRPSAVNFALVLPLAIAVCGQGSGAGITDECPTPGVAGFNAPPPFAPSDATQPGRGANAPSRAGAVAVLAFDRSTPATRVCVRAGSRVPRRSVVEVRDLFEAVTTGLLASPPPRARSVSFVAAFSARAVIEGVTAPTAGFVGTVDERVGVVDAESRASAVLLSPGSEDCTAAGEGTCNSADLDGSAAARGVRAEGVSTDGDDARGTGDSDTDDATDCAGTAGGAGTAGAADVAEAAGTADVADANGTSRTPAASVAPRRRSGPGRTAPASAARRGKSAPPGDIAIVVVADDVPR